MASKHADRRGPKVGDAASLWNFAPSPGWTKEEVQILRLCLMKFGIGQWVQILATGLLPGKLIQQLNGQTQRLLGQQSLAAYTGLRVDVDRVRADNDARADVQRKSGLIIWSGPNPTKDMRLQWQQEAKAKYGLSEPELKEVEEQLEELGSHFRSTSAAAAATASSSITAEHVAQAQALSMMDADVAQLPREVTLALLRRLRRKLAATTQLLLQLRPELAALVPAGVLQEPIEAADDPSTSGAAFKENEPSAINRMATSAAVVAKKPPSGRGGSNGSRGRGRPRLGMAQGGVRKGRGSSGPSCSSGASSAAAEARRAAMEADINQIMEMGFSRGKAKDALQEAGGSLEGAVTFLLTCCT